MSQVKWIGKDGGWKVGERVVVDDRNIIKTVKEYIGAYKVEHTAHYVLVKHAHDGKLEWVQEDKLEPYPARSERGEEPYGSATEKREPVASYDGHPDYRQPDIGELIEIAQETIREIARGEKNDG